MTHDQKIGETSEFKEQGSTETKHIYVFIACKRTIYVIGKPSR